MSENDVPGGLGQYDYQKGRKTGKDIVTSKSSSEHKKVKERLKKEYANLEPADRENYRKGYLKGVKENTD